METTAFLLPPWSPQGTGIRLPTLPLSAHLRVVGARGCTPGPELVRPGRKKLDFQVLTPAFHQLLWGYLQFLFLK